MELQVAFWALDKAFSLSICFLFTVIFEWRHIGDWSEDGAYQRGWV